MKRILFPLLALLIVSAFYAYMRTEIYNFSEKDLRVIHDADRIAVQLVAEKRVKNNVFIENFKNYLDANTKDRIAINSLQRIRQVQTLSSDLLQESNEIRAQWLQNPNQKPTELLTMFANSQKEYVSKLRNFAETSTNIGTLRPLFIAPKNNKNQENETEIDAQEFAAYFNNLPISVRLYTLTSIDAAIANREAEAIYYISQKIKYPIFEINNLVSIVTPDKIIVSEGDMYQANMKVVGVSSFTKPTLSIIQETDNYDELKTIEQQGIVNLSFIARADNYDEHGLAYKTWTGKITIELPNGKDSIFAVQENYIVRKSRNGTPISPTPTELNPNESNIIYEEPSNIE